MLLYLAIPLPSGAQHLLPNLWALCGATHMGERFVYGENMPHMDMEMQEVIQTDLVAAQVLEMTCLRKAIQIAQHTGQLVIPAAEFEVMLRAITVLRFRIQAEHLPTCTPEELENASALSVSKLPEANRQFFLWFNLLGYIQGLMCQRLLGDVG